MQGKSGPEQNKIMAKHTGHRRGHLTLIHGLPHPVRYKECKVDFWAWDEKKSHIENYGGKLEAVLQDDWRKDYWIFLSAIKFDSPYQFIQSSITVTSD